MLRNLSMKPLISGVAYCINCIPLKFMLSLLMLSLWLQEWYPISYFSMYSGYSPSLFFVYVTDGVDRSVPVLLEFGLSTSHITKAYKTRFDELNTLHYKHIEYLDENKSIAAGAGKQLLEYMIDSRRPKIDDPTDYESLKLWHAQFRQFRQGEQEKIVIERQLITDYKVP